MGAISELFFYCQHGHLSVPEEANCYIIFLIIYFIIEVIGIRYRLLYVNTLLLSSCFAVCLFVVVFIVCVCMCVCVCVCGRGAGVVFCLCFSVLLFLCCF